MQASGSLMQLDGHISLTGQIPVIITALLMAVLLVAISMFP
jgi:hypothetical protein